MDESGVKSAPDATSDSTAAAATRTPENGAHAGQGTPRRATGWPEPTVLTMQDLIDLPKQILPEHT